MKLSKPLICALFVSSLSTPVLAAPSHTSTWSASDSMGAVETKIEDKQYQAAIYDLKKIVAKDADNADAYNLLGFTHRKLKQYEVAEEYYQKALALDPKHKGALEYLGELYVETNRMDKANEMLTRLDKACFFGCDEYSTLKKMIEQKSQGLEVSSKW